MWTLDLDDSSSFDRAYRLLKHKLMDSFEDAMYTVRDNAPGTPSSSASRLQGCSEVCKDRF